MEKIAIVGISCLFPGAKTPQEFFDNLSVGKDTTSLADKAQMGVDPDLFFAAEKGVSDKYYSKKGGYIRNFNFDSSGYLLESRELELLDNLYQWSLYTAKEALQDSGYLNKKEILKRTGVVLGNLSFPTKSSNKQFLPLYRQAITTTLNQITSDNPLQLDQLKSIPQNYTNSRISGYPATIIAQALGLAGGHFALDAACASSLYSVKLACDYLLAGKTDLMLAGAVSAADPLFVNLGFSTFQAYPEDGVSCPLDARSGGLIAGEGAGMFVLKRYQEALADGDTIYAVIVGVGLSNDGRGKFALSPNPKGQRLAYERAYQDKKVTPEDIAYIECHATGTPLGDLTEINSLEQFFGACNSQLKVGSVKTNFGHLLTAAGMASMLKIIGSMASSIIPPSIKIKKPLHSTDGFINKDKIVTAKLPWPQENDNRYAAVNAFGFGGTNAHLVFMSAQTASRDSYPVSSVAKSPKEMQSMAIIGMEAHFGSATNLAQFNHYIYTGKQDRVDLPDGRWKGMEKSKQLLEDYNLYQTTPPQGAFIPNLEIDYLRYKIPPNPQDPLIAQQLLMLQVADNALLDSGLKEGVNAAVLIAMETDTEVHQLRGRVDLDWQLEQYLADSKDGIEPKRLEELKNSLKESVQNPVGLNQFTSFIGNIMASRISSLWDLTGPSFTISSEENSVFKALEIAQIMLSNGEVEAVLIGAVDLFCNIENLLLRNREFGQIRSDLPNLALESGSHGWVAGEGAGAIVLKRSTPDTKEYANIKGVSLSYCEGVNDFANNISIALNQSQITAEQIGYLELYGGITKSEQEIEIKGINRSFQNTPSALGSLKNSFGNLGVASGIAAVIKTTLLLNQRYLPGTPAWKSPLLPTEWPNQQFYLPNRSKTWYPSNQKIRYAAINSLGQDRNVAHCILAEPASRKVTQAPLFKTESTQLFPISGDNGDELIAGLTDLINRLNQGVPIYQIACELNQIKKRGELTISILGSDHEQLRKEINTAKDGVPISIKNGKVWSTPQGSYFTPLPLGKKGKLSFVYPGGFVSYQGMNRDLFQLFPQLHGLAEKISSYPERMFRDSQLFPRSLNHLSESRLKELQTELVDDAIGMFETGITASILYTHIAQKILKITPQTAFGYSMGEVSMMYALGCWGKTDKMSDILHTKPVFKTRLAGQMETLREAWGLPSATQSRIENIWECYAVSSSIKQVEQAMQGIDQVYAIIINTPNEVVIAGYPEACKKLLSKLNSRSIQLPMTDVIHCELVKADYNKIVELHTSPVIKQPRIDFYTAMNYQKTVLESKQIAQNIAQLYCQRMDFPQLVNQVYADGVRIFLELGPQGSCSKNIKEILKDKNHLAIGINRKGVDDYTALLMAVAQLKSHQVELDLTKIYSKEKIQKETQKSFVHPVVLGGHNINKTIKNRIDRKLLKQLGKTNPPLKKTEVGRPEKQEKLDFGTFHQLMDQAHHHRQLVSKTQEAFLRSQREGLRLLSETLKLKLSLQEFNQDTTATVESHPTVSSVRDSTSETADNLEPLISSHKKVQFDEQQIHEFAVGSIAKCFGSDFELYHGRKSQRNPNGDLQLLSRVLTATGIRKDFQNVASMVGEYDVHQEAWFFQQNSYPLMPYSVIMEIALQPCGFLGAFMGSPLIYPEADLHFRNLDATANLLSLPDLQNKVITCRSQLHDTSSFSTTVIQQYSFQLLVDGESFYQGKTTFGYFTADSLAKQLGIDNGKYIKPWIEVNSVSDSQKIEYDLTSARSIDRFYTMQAKQSFLFLKRGKLNFLDRAIIVATGGEHQQGYIYAEKKVDPNDWFFPCHFYQDPVMPGSLGVEAILQSMKIFALQMKLGGDFQAPYFGHSLGEMSWKYRGQIIPENKKMSLEVHIKSISQKDTQIIISGDANLWKDGLRIYTVTNAAITINDTKGEI
jgi:PfaB family protein